MKTLLIGGQEDVNWHDIPSSMEAFDVAESSYCGDLSLYAPEQQSKNESVNGLRYTQRKLSSEFGQYRVMVLLDSNECIIGKLINGYKPEQLELFEPLPVCKSRQILIDELEEALYTVTNGQSMLGCFDLGETTVHFDFLGES